jgi:hypothetical protein
MTITVWTNYEKKVSHDCAVENTVRRGASILGRQWVACIALLDIVPWDNGRKGNSSWPS